MPLTPLRFRPDLRDEADDEPGYELVDLPAAVVCARCGRADCHGCNGEERAEPSASGVVLVVPWERPDQGAWQRFWATTRLGVEAPDVFFSELPDGPVAPALSYAVMAEGLAALSCVAVCAVFGLGVLGAVLPAFLGPLLQKPSGQAAIVRALLAAWGSFSLLLVLVHGLHGWALHAMARRASLQRPLAAAATLQRALRFGFYTASFDVAACPAGVVWMLSTLGRGGLRKMSDVMFDASNRATAALLRGAYRLEPGPVERVRRRGLVVSVAAVVAGLLLCAVCVAAAALA